MKARSTRKTPKVKTPPPDPLAGVTIRAQVLTYKPDLHRWYIRESCPRI
jgi:hypothetical protein